MKNNRAILLVVLLALSFLPVSLFASEAGNATLGGVNGYLVIPSAEPVYSSKDTSVSTGYSAIITSGTFANIPYLQVGFSNTYELGLAADITENTTDLLLNVKWRLSKNGNTSMAIGAVAQAINVGENTQFAAQVYFASTFNSSFIDWPSKTTILLGYTFDDNLNTDINFGMGFEIPFFKDTFNDKLKALIDFGNVSYSVSPSAGNAENRGMINVGLRLVPIEFLKSVYISADIRALDLFDDSGRALSLGATISFRP
ncbi:hypothetical protein [uncultured Sphaerochaeta sp.]|uniref:hypothetical protein n=1 Tax=uncultured Sphaerochaeta sp. TaxID=886478 RepID=UPI002A0A8BB1|nr:hypothetical protein [uncultured Sphaerochaeta sp.]